MHATMALLAISFPDWNSLESVRRVHNNLEVAALAFFALLVVSEALSHLADDKKRSRALDTLGIIFFAIAVLAEIAAYPYGQRNDDLSSEKISSLDIEAGEAFDKSSRANDLAQRASDIAKPAKETADEARSEADAAALEANAVAKKAGHIDAELSVAQAALGGRHILNEEGLRNDLAKNFKGKLIVFKSYVQDEEAFMLCKQLVSAAGKPQTGVTAEDECADEAVRPHLPFTDLRVTAPTIEEATQLAMMIKSAGVAGLSVNLGQTPEITVLVGKQASVPLFWPKTPKGDSKTTSKTRAK